MAETLPSKAEQRIAQLEYQLDNYRRMFEGDERVQQIRRMSQAVREACEPAVVELDGEKHWVLTLNKYQRDNLLWLCAAIGYPSPEFVGEDNLVEPFHLANTGDWVGEIANMLMEDGAIAMPRPGDDPNMSIKELRKAVDYWRKRVE